MKKIVFTLAMFSIAMIGYAQTPIVEGADGKVGIGTSTPSTKLEIKSNEYKQLLLSNHGSEKLYLGSVWTSVGSFISNNSYYYSSHVYTALDDVSNGIQFRETGDINFFSNTGLTPNTNFLPTSRLSIKSNGNVGVGTATPSEKLEVLGNLKVSGNIDLTGSNKRLFLGGSSGGTFGIAYSNNYPDYGIFYTEGASDFVSISPNGNSKNGVLNVYGNGKVGIGTVDPQSKLEVYHSTQRTVQINPQNQLDVTGNSSLTIKEFVPSIEFHDSSSSSADAVAFVNGNRFYIGKKTGIKITSSSLFNVGLNDGKVGIGTIDTGSHRLAVEGSIGAREIKVEAYPNWSDFVFEKEYKLPTLTQVENHIKEKGHLKDIPSAAEVKKDGFFLGEMDAKLLQKIEELTLYTIEQEKKINKTENINKKLLSVIEKLEKRITKLEENK